MAAPTIELYTNHLCPWAHRAHIALAELGLPFTEHIIDLETPRSPEYLAINPRGLVPTLVYNGEIIPESGIVSQFLADAHPSRLAKASSEEGGALQRARINFFADAFTSKVVPKAWAGLRAQTPEELEAVGRELVDAVVKEVEPLLANAAPFFGGSDRLTLAEVLTGSFVLRLVSFPEAGIARADLWTLLEKEAPNFSRWARATAAEKSVNHIYDATKVAEKMKKKFGVQPQEKKI
jgi:glutathione S-transferase